MLLQHPVREQASIEQPKGLLLRYLYEIRDEDNGGLALTARLPTLKRVAEKKLASDPVALKDCLEVLEAFTLGSER